MQARRFIQNPLFQAQALALLFVGAYFVPFRALYNTWMTNDDYSYGVLIPFISLYFLWDQKHRLSSVDIKTWWPAFPALVLFILVSLYGVLGSSGNISMPALPVLIVLFALFCFGKDLFKQIWFPLFFLAFMVPLPAVLDRSVGLFLKRISSQMGGQLLRSWGYSVHVSGNVIDLGITRLQVVDACSGLRFVFPLLALGVFYAYCFEKITWKRIACVAVTLPISILTNILRIGIAGFLTYNFGPEMAEGFFHDFQGFAVFMVAFACLFIFGRVLRFFPSDSVQQSPDSPDVSPALPGRTRRVKNMDALLVCAVLLAIVAGLTLNTQALPPVKIKGGITAFPKAFNDWQGKPQPISSKIIDASGAEEAFSGLYNNGTGRTVSLYLGYRSTAFLENVNFFHSPTVCLPSSGWKTRKKSRRMVAEVPGFDTLPVTEMVMEDTGGTHLVYFWFQTRTRATHDKNINRFHLALHALQKDNTHDLFIRPITHVNKDETLDEARNRMDRFVRDMMGTLASFLEKKQYIDSSNTSEG